MIVRLDHFESLLSKTLSLSSSLLHFLSSSCCIQFHPSLNFLYTMDSLVLSPSPSPREIPWFLRNLANKSHATQGQHSHNHLPLPLSLLSFTRQFTPKSPNFLESLMQFYETSKSPKCLLSLSCVPSCRATKWWWWDDTPCNCNITRDTRPSWLCKILFHPSSFICVKVEMQCSEKSKRSLWLYNERHILHHDHHQNVRRTLSRIIIHFLNSSRALLLLTNFRCSSFHAYSNAPMSEF